MCNGLHSACMELGISYPTTMIIFDVYPTHMYYGSGVWPSTCPIVSQQQCPVELLTASADYCTSLDSHHLVSARSVS